MTPDTVTPDTVTFTGWQYLYEQATGRLLAEGNVWADPLPPGTALYDHAPGMQHDPDTERWDATACSIVPFTDRDRADQLDAEAAALMAEAGRLRGD